MISSLVLPLSLLCHAFQLQGVPLVDARGTPPAGLATGAGYEVVLVAGQSNTHFGTGLDLAQDAGHPRILQYGRFGLADRRVIPAFEPLQHLSAQPDKIGFAMPFARRLLAQLPPQRDVLLVPTALTGSGFATGHWHPGSPIYDDAVARVNEVLALSPHHRLAAILWHQGEADVGSPTYAADLDNMIASMRQDIVGAQTTPFLLGTLVQSWVADDPDRIAVDGIIRDTVLRMPYTAVADLSGLSSDGISLIDHFSATAQREIGGRYFDRLDAARLNDLSGLPPAAPPTLRAASGQSGRVTLIWRETDPRGSAILDYEIDFKLSTDVTWTLVATVPGAENRAELIHASIVDGMTYDFRVRAVNVFGASVESAVVTATPWSPSAGPGVFHIGFELDYADFGAAPGVEILPFGSVRLIDDAQRGVVCEFVDEKAFLLTLSQTNGSYTKATWFRADDMVDDDHLMGSSLAGGTVHALWLTPSGADGYTLYAGHGSTLAELTRLSAGPAAVTPATWHHACVTYDAATDEGRLYLDGLLVDTDTLVPLAAGQDLVIGNFDVTPAPSSAIEGALDDVRFFDVALTAGQVMELYTGEM